MFLSKPKGFKNGFIFCFTGSCFHHENFVWSSRKSKIKNRIFSRLITWIYNPFPIDLPNANIGKGSIPWNITHVEGTAGANKTNNIVIVFSIKSKTSYNDLNFIMDVFWEKRE